MFGLIPCSISFNPIPQIVGRYIRSRSHPPIILDIEIHGDHISSYDKQLIPRDYQYLYDYEVLVIMDINLIVFITMVIDMKDVKIFQYLLCKITPMLFP